MISILPFKTSDEQQINTRTEYTIFHQMNDKQKYNIGPTVPISNRQIVE
jgi:hypothetical protein